MPQKPIKPCSFHCVEDSASNFDDVIKCAKWMHRRFPSRYAAALTKSRKTCNVIYSKYAVNLPGAFRPRLTPSGLWEYKRGYLNEGITRPIHSGLVLPAGGKRKAHTLTVQTLLWMTTPLILGLLAECTKAL